jgi:putative hydrolase of the HAD superfamily
MHSIQAVLFDYGVVLSGPPDPTAWARLLAITGLPDAQFRPAYWAPRDDYDRGAHSGESYWRAVGRHAGLELTDEQICQLIDADNALWTQVNQPMVDWALRLQAAGTPTGVLSNLGDAITDGVLARQPWLAGFDHLLWSHALKLAKPDPAIYRHAADGLGFPPENILFIDDRAENVAGGIAAGMQVILYTTQPALEAEMETRGFGALLRL